jgi:hypothetical protein
MKPLLIFGVTVVNIKVIKINVYETEKHIS